MSEATVKRKIGFTPNPPTEETWQKQIGNRIFVSTKTKVGDGFLYNCDCERGDSMTRVGHQSSLDLTRDEVERVPRFVEFAQPFTGNG